MLFLLGWFPNFFSLFRLFWNQFFTWTEKFYLTLAFGIGEKLETLVKLIFLSCVCFNEFKTFSRTEISQTL